MRAFIEQREIGPRVALYNRVIEEFVSLPYASIDYPRVRVNLEKHTLMEQDGMYIQSTGSDAWFRYLLAKLNDDEIFTASFDAQRYESALFDAHGAPRLTLQAYQRKHIRSKSEQLAAEYHIGLIDVIPYYLNNFLDR